MSSLAVQAQWNIDYSAGSVIRITRGILEAATTDNVQVLAIIACEQFGATLAICQETRMKIEKTVLPTPEPAVIDFLKVTVGFSKGDCASQLGNSYSGVQFLGLATALVTSFDTFEAANAIQGMLVESAAEKTLVPTVRQIQHLLDSIEPRCTRAGFIDEVLGWQMLLDKACGFKPNNYSVTRDDVYPKGPGRQGIQHLVNAFRQLHRVGNADISGITIRLGFNAAAWTIAFTKWCLGIPPSLRLNFDKDEQRILLQQPGSAVSLSLSEDRSFEVITHSTINNPTELIDSNKNGPQAVGMVSMRLYGDRLLHWLELNDELVSRALHQAIPHALRQVTDCLILQTESYKEKEDVPHAVLPTINRFDWKFNQSERQSNQSNTRLDIN